MNFGEVTSKVCCHHKYIVMKTFKILRIRKILLWDWKIVFVRPEQCCEKRLSNYENPNAEDESKGRRGI
jgi:hypothetical protein